MDLEESEKEKGQTMIQQASSQTCGDATLPPKTIDEQDSNDDNVIVVDIGRANSDAVGGGEIVGDGSHEHNDAAKSRTTPPPAAAAEVAEAVAATVSSSVRSGSGSVSSDSKAASAIAELQGKRQELLNKVSALLQHTPTISASTATTTEAAAHEGKPRQSAEAETHTKTDTDTIMNIDADACVETMHAAEEVVKRHIAQLHQYNALRDIATGLMGLIAEARGVRVVDVYSDFNVSPTD